MKKIIVYLGLSLTAISLFAQNKTIICGKVHSTQPFVVSIYTPINGYYNLAFFDTSHKNSVLINGKDSIYKAISLTGPTFVCVRFENEKKEFLNRTNILLFPGDSVNLQLSPEIDNPSWASYSGSNCAGQELFNKINYQPYTKFIPVDRILNGLPANKNIFVKEIEDCVVENINKFKALKRVTNISPQFINTMEVCFKTLLYDEVINKFIHNYKQREVITKADRDLILDKLLSEITATDIQIKGLYDSNVFFNDYVDYFTYKKYKLHSIEVLYQKDSIVSINKNKFLVNKYLIPMLFIENKSLQQDLWALNLLRYFDIVSGMYDETTINQYCAIFPGNKWESYLRRQLKDKLIISDITYKLQSPIKYIDSDKSIKRFADLLKELPSGKPIFVDCWATWCAPCVGAFAYNKSLDSLLLANSIERLYISLDNPAVRQTWKNFVNQYCLGGYHILANKELITDVKRICGIPNPEQSPFEIPRYLLINKNGVVVIKKAISPQDFEMLKNQITLSLN